MLMLFSTYLSIDFFPHKLGKFYSYAFVSAEQQGATAAIINQAVKLIFIEHNN